MAILRKAAGKRDNWATPKPVYEKRNRLHQFTLDLCAEPWNAKHKRFYSISEELPASKRVDSLSPSVQWRGRCWLQPPYSQIWEWLEKAFMSTLSRKLKDADRAEVIDCLLPARTDSDWFHEFVLPFGRPEFIRGRINMIPPPGYKPEDEDDAIDPATGKPFARRRVNQPGEASIFVTFQPRWVANDLWRNGGAAA